VRNFLSFAKFWVIEKKSQKFLIMISCVFHSYFGAARKIVMRMAHMQGNCAEKYANLSRNYQGLSRIYGDLGNWQLEFKKCDMITSKKKKQPKNSERR
jgi:hypothetical protein